MKIKLVQIGKENDLFLTTTQAAEYLNVSLSTLKKIIDQGQIKTFRTPGGHHRIRKEDLLKGLYPEKNGKSDLKGKDVCSLEKP